MNKRSPKSDNPLLKECLFTALILLMDQKDFKDITISEITQKAGVSRMTYYRTYSSKEDILRQYFNDQSKKLLADILAQPDLSAYEFFCQIFYFFKDNAHMIEFLYKAELLIEVLDQFIEFAEKIYEKTGIHRAEDSMKAYEIRFIAGGLFQILIHWIQCELKESPEEMARMTLCMLHIPSSEPEKDHI